MLAYHRRMLAFDHWANTVSLDAVEPVAERVPRSLAWLNHILGAKRIWLARVTGAESPFGVNPTFGPPELRVEFHLANEGWSRFLATQSAADVARVIRYTNLKGDPFESVLGDILAHLPVHGQHHRGQVNADLRAAGIIPPAIDYIHAARTGVLT
ncbi:MAG: DinB family protein [Vicinamibacterales bacterium]